MRRNAMGLAAVFGLVLLAVPVVGHHSFDVQFDSNKTRDITGVITKVDWINPHAYLHVNVVEEDGKVVNFKIEMGPPYAITRNNNEMLRRLEQQHPEDRVHRDDPERRTRPGRETGSGRHSRHLAGCAQPAKKN